MKALVFIAAILCLFLILLAVAGIILYAIFGSVYDEGVTTLFYMFWAFVVLAILYVLLGGNLKDFMFWKNRKKM